MKILFINSVCGVGSTGRICTDLYDLAVANGHTCCIAYGRGEAPDTYQTIKIGSNIDNYLHVIKARVGDQEGLGSYKATVKFIKDIDKFSPDIIHLHNIHGYYLNHEILFKYLKSTGIKVIWTLHDCWSFTGHCAYYLYKQCNKWQINCENCPQINEYPKSYRDNSSSNYQRKRNLFLTLNNNLTIVAVSSWLEKEIEKSYLNSIDRTVIISGIDTNIFHYRKGLFREIHNLENKKIILGVASVWDERKGINDFIELSKVLPEKFVIVLVGLSKQQIRLLPKNILGIENTTNATELAEIYSTADLFFNPSKEETFGLTNFEAQACGTTTISYNSGGTPETLVTDYGYVIENNINAFMEFITNYNFDQKKNQVDSRLFDKTLKLDKYLDLYEEIFLGSKR